MCVKASGLESLGFAVGWMHHEDLSDDDIVAMAPFRFGGEVFDSVEHAEQAFRTAKGSARKADKLRAELKVLREKHEQACRSRDEWRERAILAGEAREAMRA